MRSQSRPNLNRSPRRRRPENVCILSSLLATRYTVIGYALLATRYRLRGYWLRGTLLLAFVYIAYCVPLEVILVAGYAVQ